MHTRKHTDVQLGGRLTSMPSNSYPVDLPPQQYARSPFNSMPFFLKPWSKMPPEKHKNVQRPMSILLHRSNNILQQASGKTYTKRKTNTIKNSGDAFTTIKNTWSSQSQSMIEHEGSTRPTQPGIIVIGNAYVPRTSS